MLKLHGLLLPLVGAAVCLVVVAAAESKADTPSHSTFYSDFRAESMVTFCQDRFKFVKDICGWGSRGLGIKWNGQKLEEDFKIFDLTGDLSDDEVKTILEALPAELVKRARASKAVVAHDPKDSIVDRPMRLLQAGFVWAGTAVIPSRVRGFYFTYKEGTVEGAVDVLAIPMVKDKKSEWLVLGTVHEVAR